MSHRRFLRRPRGQALKDGAHLAIAAPNTVLDGIFAGAGAVAHIAHAAVAIGAAQHQKHFDFGARALGCHGHRAVQPEHLGVIAAGTDW